MCPIGIKQLCIKLLKNVFFSENNKELFVDKLREVDWTPVYILNDGNLAYQKFYEIYFKLYDSSFPLSEVRPRKAQNNEPFITPGLKHSIRESKRLHRLALKWPYSYRERYINFNKTLKNSLKIAKNLYYNKILKDSQGDPKRI